MGIVVPAWVARRPGARAVAGGGEEVCRLVPGQWRGRRATAGAAAGRSAAGRPVLPPGVRRLRASAPTSRSAGNLLEVLAEPARRPLVDPALAADRRRPDPVPGRPAQMAVGVLQLGTGALPRPGGRAGAAGVRTRSRPMAAPVVGLGRHRQVDGAEVVPGPPMRSPTGPVCVDRPRPAARPDQRDPAPVAAADGARPPAQRPDGRPAVPLLLHDYGSYRHVLFPDTGPQGRTTAVAHWTRPPAESTRRRSCRSSSLRSATPGRLPRSSSSTPSRRPTLRPADAAGRLLALLATLRRETGLRVVVAGPRDHRRSRPHPGRGGRRSGRSPKSRAGPT